MQPRKQIKKNSENSIQSSVNKVVLYAAQDGSTQLEVTLENDTVWLSQQQIALLFGTQRPAITKHLQNIFKTKELDQRLVCSKMEHTAADGKVYLTNFYNLDAIISIGYRVNSKYATQFRIWATTILHQHIVDGFTVNERRLRSKANHHVRELQKAIALLRNAIHVRELSDREAKGLLYVITEYADAWVLLQQYDEQTIVKKSKQQKYSYAIEYAMAKEEISVLKDDLMRKGQASEFFGKERGDALAGILGAIKQSFGGTPLYATIEEHAAHLLYFVIKDHPFTDGNKRIASFLFVVFLNKNRYLLDKNGERKINDNALVALALLVAESKPQEKDIIIALITNLL